MTSSSRVIFSKVSFAAITLCLLFTAGGSPASSPAAGKPGGPSIRGEHVPDEVLVKFRPSVGKAERDDVRSHLGAARLRRFRSGAEHWKLGHGQLAEEGIARLRSNPHVEYAEPNYLIHLDRVPNDPRFPELWGLRNTGQQGGVVGADIHAESAWNVGTGSRNVLVAIIDTGIDYTHPDLVANVWTNPGEIPGNGIDDDHNGFIDDVHGYDFVNHDGDPRDDNGHGTHVSGTIGAVGDNGTGVVGVNWQVSLIGVKFLSGGGFGSTADAISAVDYAAMLHVSVMNASWGGGDYSQALYDAIGGSGALFIAAAGNDGQDNDVFPHYPSNYDLPNIIAVAATDRFDHKANFSDWGATTVDLGAPGVDILSTVPGGGYGILSGTSMATPHVSGAAALVRAAAPGLGILQIKQRLLDGADRIPALAGITVSGGRLNAFLPIAEPDTVPPGAIADLYAVDPASNSIALTWTATGDDGNVGTAAFYDLRYATTPIDDAGFASATQVQGVPAPAAAGSAERFEVTGLDPDTIYYFAIKAMDEWGNVGPLSLVASARTLPPPTLYTAPDSFSVALLSGQITTRTLTIENAGVGTLDWSIPQPGAGAAAGVGPVIEGRGGPDASGYLFIDSDEPGGPAFAWTDIASTGTLIGGLTGDDRTSGPVPLGFHMPFYGQVFDSVRVSTNGFLSFTSSRTDNVNLSLPSPGGPGNLVAPFWDDLDFRTSGTAVYAADTDSFTVQYTGIGKVGSPGLCTFQVTLYRNGEIAFRYLSMAAETRSSTVGIQNANGTIGLGIAFNSVYVHDQLAVRIMPPAHWLGVSPTSGRLAAGERRDVTLTFNAEGLEGGHYETPLFVESNDPLRPRAEHAVALDVTGAPAITVRPASLEFGTVFSGFARTLELTVDNIGTDLLTVSGIVSADPAVTVAPSSMTLPPHASGKVAVTYAPLSPGSLDASLTISSDASNTPTLLIHMTGVSSPAPEIGVAPTSYSETLLTGGTAVRGLTITNGGGSDLVVHLTSELVAGAAVQGIDRSPAGGTLALPAPEMVNGGFESGDFSGWTARSNGREELISWRVTRAGAGWWGNSQPAEGSFDALNGFDGVAGLEYELYQDLTIPYGTIDAHLTFLDRIQFDSLGIHSTLPRIYEATIRDESGGVLDTFVHEEILLNGHSYTDRGWQERSVDLTPYVGRTVRLHIREYIPETYTGPATIEFDNFHITAAVLPEWLKVTPSDAVIAPGASAPFNVAFDADSLDAMVLVGSIRLDTNTPDAPVLHLPATLTVVGAPNLHTAQDRLDFGDAYVGFGDSLELTVLNDGPEPLQVTRID
ncbi:MAG TPA: S8 family serine peptidase, partial [Candidatus Polarisedimenticolia bacterium]|nr:S8 family serine peptidase [Candidatus Polarisedimenticolia bacterium]